jgi:hypothetical protein
MIYAYSWLRNPSKFASPRWFLRKKTSEKKKTELRGLEPDNSVHTVIKRTNRGSIHGIGKKFSFLQNDQIGCGTHPVSHLMRLLPKV